MNTCTELSDRMPDVALGRSAWTETEQRHLAGCADCRAEWELVTAASRLGATIPATDPALVSTLLLARLTREHEQTRVRIRLWSAAGLAAAAAVILALWTGGRLGGLAGDGRRSPTPRVATAPVMPTSSTDPAASGDSIRTAAGVPDTTVRPMLATTPAGGQPAELPLPELDDLPAEALDSILQVAGRARGAR